MQTGISSRHSFLTPMPKILNMKKYALFAIIIQIVVCLGCEHNYLGYDIELWRDTEVWLFAKSISKHDFDKAELLLKQNHLDVDCREPKFGETLLSWAVLNNDFDAVKFLVDHGANPNAHNTYNGVSPIADAASGVDSIDILKYLLEHGGDPNDYVHENEVLSYRRSVKTPLIRAAFISLEKTKLLVRNGADVNFAVEPGYTPLISAEWKMLPDVLDYLFFECKADYNKSYVITIDGNDTIPFRELINKRRVVSRDDSIIAKRIIEYIDKQSRQKMSSEK